MTLSLALRVFLGGVLTILGPCMLPVLTLVSARAEQPLLRNGLQQDCSALLRLSFSIRMCGLMASLLARNIWRGASDVQR
jgi:cytochrome c biogenesis protein CcdA